MKSTTRIEIKFLIPSSWSFQKGRLRRTLCSSSIEDPFRPLVRDPSGETVFVDSNRQIYQWKRRFEPIALVGYPKPHVANAVEDENGDLVLWPLSRRNPTVRLGLDPLADFRFGRSFREGSLDGPRRIGRGLGPR